MKKNIFSPIYYCALLSCMLLYSSTIITQDLYQDEYTDTQQNASDNQQELYIRLDEEMSNITEVIDEIAALDPDQESPVHLFKQHIENGYLLGLEDEIFMVLDYADSFVQQLSDGEIKRTMTEKLDEVIDQVVSGELTVDKETIMNSPHLRLLTIDHRVSIKHKAIFKNIVVMDKKLRVHGRARFYSNVHFKDNVTIDDTLSANDAVIANLSAGTLSVTDTISTPSLSVSCDLTVGCNISMVDSTDTAHGNIVKNGTTFIHNFGTNNVFVGKNSGNFTTSGIGQNIGLGNNTLSANTIGFENIAIGFGALSANTTGIRNTAVGDRALTDNTTGQSNTGIGFGALADNTTGGANTAVGRSALELLGSGAKNTGVGTFALQLNTTGSNNTAVGYAAGTFGMAPSQGSDNISIGALAGTDSADGNNNIMIGNIGDAADSSVIRIGDPQLKCFIAGIRGVTTDVNDAITVLIDSNGQLGTISSSAQFKDDIRDLCDESAAILKLHPVSFIYKSDSTKTRQFGLIAEEVDKVFPRLVIKDKNGQPFTVRYEVLPVLLLNEVKKLVNKVETMVTQEEVQKLVDRIAVLEKIIS